MLTTEQSNKIANMGFVCTLLVVAIHVRHVPQAHDGAPMAFYFIVRHIFGSIAVPFFFIVSGYFLARRAEGDGWWKRAVAQRLRTLGLPLFIWCLIPFLLFSVIWTAGEPGGICSRIPFRPSSLAAGFGLNLFTNPEANRPLWYLRMLLLLVTASPCLIGLIEKTRGWILLFFCACCWTFNPGTLDFPDFWLSVRWQIFWVFGISVEGLLYFSVGLYLGRYPVGLSRRVGLVAGSLGLLVGFVGMYLRLKDIVGWSYCVTVSIPLVMALVWTVMPCSAWNRNLIGNAFAIYVIHPLVIRSFHALDLIPGGSASALIEWSAVVATSLLIAMGLHRALPRFSAVAFGGR